MHSHHSHSGEFCLHAVDNLTEVIDEVVRMGFKMFAMTEHMPRMLNSELYPEEVRIFYI